jgi:hypothetical protein
MFFLKNRVSLPIEDRNLNSTSETPNETPIFFLYKSLRQIDFNSGPEHPYEDEAWAPEASQIGLFSKKRRSITEE